MGQHTWCRASTTLISLSFYAHYSASIHFLPKLFGTCHLFVILNIQCKFRFNFFFLPELEFIFKGIIEYKFQNKYKTELYKIYWLSSCVAMVTYDPPLILSNPSSESESPGGGPGGASIFSISSSSCSSRIFWIASSIAEASISALSSSSSLDKTSVIEVVWQNNYTYISYWYFKKNCLWGYPCTSILHYYTS